VIRFVAGRLAWDARLRPGAAADVPPDGARSGPRSRGGVRLAVALALLTADVLYAVAVGSFIHFSWPATRAAAWRSAQ
jgi:hypothetical protein